MPDRYSGGMTRNGLPVDPVKDREWRNRSQRRAADRKAEKLRRSATRAPKSNASTVRRQTSQQRDDQETNWSGEVRAQAYERSGRLCEAGLPGCHGRAAHLHHRKLRRHGDHTISNALDVCLHCHDVIHRLGNSAYDKGLLLRPKQNPATVTVLRRGARVLLTSDGTYREAA